LLFEFALRRNGTLTVRAKLDRFQHRKVIAGEHGREA
jgi:hypothetical protein